MKIDGLQEPVCNPVNAAADRFNYRHKTELDVALEALPGNWQHGKQPVDALWHCAAANRAAHVMRTYLDERDGMV